MKKEKVNEERRGIYEKRIPNPENHTTVNEGTGPRSPQKE